MVKKGNAVFFYVDNRLAGSLCLGQKALGDDRVRGQAKGQGIPGGVKLISLGLTGCFDPKEEKGS